MPHPQPELQPYELSDQDIHRAMQEVRGYIDITPGDFKEIYRTAFRLALERLRQAVRVGEVMHQPVITVNRDTPVAEVAALLAQHRIAGVPVVAEGQVLGMVTERDFLSHLGSGRETSFMAIMADCLSSRKCVALQVRGRTAGDLMRAPALTIEITAPLAEAAALMSEQEVNRLPVVDARGDLAGIICRSDLIRAGFFQEAPCTTSEK